jgi:large subunit ribosomal protein L23
MISLSYVLLSPLVSEKATRAGDKANFVCFWVNPKASKLDIKRAVEHYFPDTNVEKITTSVLGRRKVKFGQTVGRSVKRKKAFVKLRHGQQINFAELS